MFSLSTCSLPPRSFRLGSHVLLSYFETDALYTSDPCLLGEATPNISARR